VFDNVDCLKLLIENGAKSDCVDDYQNTLLHLAVKAKNLKALKFLKSLSDESFFTRNSKGETALNICNDLQFKEGMAITEELFRQFDRTKAQTDSLLNELSENEKKEQESKNKKKSKKWRNKINKLAKA
jgi:ankyrin repeat protein